MADAIPPKGWGAPTEAGYDYVMSEKFITDWIPARLEEVGKRQSDLAQAMGITPSKLSKTLSGQRKLQLQELRPMCECLRLRIEDAMELFEGRTDKAPPMVAEGPSERLVERVVLYVLTANEQFGSRQTNAQLASTIAQFSMNFRGDPKNFELFERQLRDAITTAVQFTPKPSIGVD